MNSDDSGKYLIIDTDTAMLVSGFLQWLESCEILQEHPDSSMRVQDKETGKRYEIRKLPE